MVAANHDGGDQFAGAHQPVDRQSELGALAVAQPADARRQSLKLNALACQREPSRQRLVVREHLGGQPVGAVDVRGIAGERHPAERSAAFAEQRADVFGHEAGDIEGALHAGALACVRMLLP